MADETKRIKDLAVTTSPSDSDVLPVDNDTNGTRGISFLDLANRVFNRLGFVSIGGGSSVFSGQMSASDFVAGQNKLSEKADKVQIDTIQSQINNVISSVSTDSELTDIRVKADGTTALSAGAAVREQVLALKTRVDGCGITATDDGNGTVTLSFINN